MNERLTLLLADDSENDLALLSTAFRVAAIMRCLGEKVFSKSLTP